MKTQSKNLFLTMILVAIILSQMVLICYLLVRFLEKNKRSLIPLSKENFKQEKTSNYKNYYEPVPKNYCEPIPWDNGKVVVYGINSDTLRSNVDYGLKKNSKTIRIVSLGDSFTFGEYVKDDETYPLQLENKLNEYFANRKKIIEVLNFGVSGFDVQYEVERYKLRGEKYDPDYVVWFLNTDDFTNIDEPELELTYYYQKHLTKVERERYAQILGGDSRYLEYAIGSYEVRKKLTLDGILKNNLRAIEKFASTLNNKLIIIMFRHLPTLYRDGVKKICKKTKCIVYDNLPNIYNDETLYLPDKHPNKKGYSRIVDSLGEEMIKIINE